MGLLWAMGCGPAASGLSTPVPWTEEDSGLVVYDAPDADVLTLPADTGLADPGPVPGELRLRPRRPVADLDGLTCEIDVPFEAPDGSELRHTLRWTLDGDDMPMLDGRSELAVDLLEAGQTWVCTVVATNGVYEAEARASVEITDGPWDLDPWVHPELWVEPRDAKPGDTITVHYAGDVESPRLDYSFDGWRQGGASQAYEDMGYRYFERASFVEGLAHWRLEVQVPEDANALDVRVVDLDGKASDEHHHGFVFPYLGPYLHYTPDVQPADGIVVSWEAATPSWGVVAWGTDPHPRNLVVGDTWDTLHHVPLTGLPADSEIYYQVYSPDGRKTKVHSFRTPGDPDDALQVLFLSDMQDDGTPDELWGAIAGEVSDRYGDADLMILPGDLAYSDEPGFWWMFFHRGRHLFAEVPMVAAVGNHDTPGKASNADDQDSFLRYMALDEPWYQVVWGGLRALVLSSEDSAGMELGSEQLTWAASALEEGWAGDERLDRWTFATWHHPPYDIGGRFAAQAEDYRDPTALFDSRVDWVLTGHEHIYQRFHPMRYVAELVDSYGLGEDQGVGYLVLPSAGNRTYTDVVQEGQEGADQRELVAFPELVDGQTDTPVAVGWAVADLTPESLELTVWGMGTKGEPEAATVREIFVQER